MKTRSLEPDQFQTLVHRQETLLLYTVNQYQPQGRGPVSGHVWFGTGPQLSSGSGSLRYVGGRGGDERKQRL